MLILFTGLPGVGKSTLAKAYAARSGALHLSSDLIRAELGLRGHYLQEEKQKVYDALLKRAGEALQAGKSVVIDSTLYRSDLRRPYIKLAEQCHTPVCLIELKATETTIRQRVSRLRLDSEADSEVYDKIRAAYEAIDVPHLELWTDTADTDVLLTHIEAYIANHDR